MAIGAYDQPAQSNLINTYQQLPFEAILQAGMARQGRYEQTVESMDSAQDYLDQLQAIQGEHENYLNQSKIKMGEIASKYANQDLSQTYVRRQLKDEIRRSIDPSTINRISQSKKNFDEAQKLKAEYDMRGLLYAPYDQAMDPALNGSLKLSQTYDYQPRAFQDPEKVVGDYFSKISPDKKVVTSPDGMIKEITTRSLSKLQNAVSSDYRTFADTPQGQWVVSQYMKNNPGTELTPDDIVKGYMNDVAKRYVVTGEDYVGYDPDAKSRASGKNKTVPVGFIGNIYEQGRAEEKDEKEWKPKENLKAISSVQSQIDKVNSDLRNKNIGSKQRLQKQLELDDLNSEKLRLQKIREDVLVRAGQPTELDTNQKNTIFTKLKDKHPGLLNEEADLAIEVGEMLFNTKTSGRYDAGDKWLKENYPGIDDASKRRVLSAAIGAPYNTAYSLIKDYMPSKSEIKQSFKEQADKLDAHPGMVPYSTSRSSGGIEFVLNGKTGEYDTPSAAQDVIKGIKLNPDLQKLEIYRDNKYVTIGNDKSAKSLMDKFNAGKNLTNTIIPIMPNKDGEFQLEFRLQDKDDKVSEDVYRTVLNDQSQLNAFARDYRTMSNIDRTGVADGNYTRSYVFSNPRIASDYATQKNLDTRRIVLSGSEDNPIEVFIKKNTDRTRDIVDAEDNVVNMEMPDGSIRPLSGLDSDESTLQLLYEIQMNLDPRVVQEIDYIRQSLNK
jgi:hypothetical protein